MENTQNWRVLWHSNMHDGRPSSIDEETRVVDDNMCQAVTAAFCHIKDVCYETMETGVSQMHVRSCGTAFELNCDKLTLAFNDLSGY